jgi:hypothetical protein
LSFCVIVVTQFVPSDDCTPTPSAIVVRGATLVRLMSTVPGRRDREHLRGRTQLRQRAGKRLPWS